MPTPNPLGIGPLRPSARIDAHIIRRIVHSPLQRILAFTGRSINDVVNDPLIKNEICGYFKLAKHIDRRSQVVDERQAEERLHHGQALASDGSVGMDWEQISRRLKDTCPEPPLPSREGRG